MSELIDRKPCNTCINSKIEDGRKMLHRLYRVCKDGYTPRDNMFCKFYMNDKSREIIR